MILLSQDLIQHVGEHTSGVVVIDFRRGIEAAFERGFDLSAVRVGGGEDGGLHGLELAGDAGVVEFGFDEVF